MNEQLATEWPSKRFMLNYLERVLPNLPAPSERLTSAKVWASRIFSSHSPLDSAREEAVQFWDFAESFLDLPPAPRDKALTEFTNTWIANEAMLACDVRLQEDVDQGTSSVRGDAAAMQQSLSQAVEVVIDSLKPPLFFRTYGDLLDVDAVRQNAKIKLQNHYAPDIETAESLKRKAVVIFRSAYIDELRRLSRHRKNLQVEWAKGPDEVVDSRASVVERLISAQDRSHSESFLYWWITETKLDFHKVLAFFWISLGLPREWEVYPERQFGLLLSRSVDLIEDRLDSELLQHAIRERSKATLTDNTAPYGWLVGKAFQDLIWNDFVNKDAVSMTPGRQFNDWVSVAKKNADSLVRATWDTKMRLLKTRLEHYSIVEKLCYLLTKGLKKTVPTFISLHAEDKILSLSVALNGYPSTNWLRQAIATSIDRGHIPGNVSLRHYFGYGRLEALAAGQALEARLRSTVNAIHRELSLEILRELEADRICK